MSRFTMGIGSVPATPPSGYIYIYPKSDKKMYFKDDTGTESELGESGMLGWLPLVANRLLASDASGEPTALAVTDTEASSLAGVTSNIQTQFAGKQPIDSDLTAIAGLSTNGFLVRIAAGSASTRSILGTSGQIAIADGDGVAGNPVVSLIDTGVTASTYGAGDTVPVVQIDAKGRIVSVTDTPISILLSAVSDLSISATDLNSLDDGADSTLHFHASDRARANHTGSQTASTISDFSSAADARITLQKGSANGLATLDGSSKIPAVQLPSYVDDVLEFADFASFPVTGETGKIYIAIDTSKTYRWSGSIYVEISPSEVNSVNGQTGVVILDTDDITEGSAKYFTDERAQDAIGAALSDTSTIDLSYDDALNILTAAIKVLSIDDSLIANAAAIALSKLGTLATPVESYRPVNAGDTIQQAIDKILYTSTILYRNITSDVTIPTEMTWIRANTRIAGTAKLRVVGTGRVRFI